jgi:cell division protein FtsI (penicillin-binding protein 3)/stage V sporulation protein D (sporulation-specific penicillin-binding protein)
VENFEIFQNSAVQNFFEPGSIFKPITMASALEEGKVTAQTTYVDTGKLKIGNYTIYNYDQRVWGERTMNEVLEKSINTGAVFAERQVGHDVFLEYLKRFGFFEPTGIDLQGEVFSENKELKKGREINFATASFGQGIEVTPIQMLRAFSAIANGGKLVKPYLVEKIVKDKETIETKEEISKSNIISSKTAAALTDMLISVVERGSARFAKISGYNIAGKTGTSQIPFSALGINKKGYSEKTWQSFIGFAPAFGAKFVILIKLDNPKIKTSEYSAAPIFGKLANYILNYLEIPPDYE